MLQVFGKQATAPGCQGSRHDQRVVETKTPARLDIQCAVVQRSAGGHLQQWHEHGVEVASRGIESQRDLCLAQGRVQAFLDDLETDAGIAAGQPITDDSLGQFVLARIRGVQVVGEDVGVDEDVSARSSRPG